MRTTLLTLGEDVGSANFSSRCRAIIIELARVATLSYNARSWLSRTRTNSVTARLSLSRSGEAPLLGWVETRTHRTPLRCTPSDLEANVRPNTGQPAGESLVEPACQPVPLVQNSATNAEDSTHAL